MEKKKIGIIGSGIVAKTLGTGFLKHGFEVMLGTRDSSKLQDWLSENNGQVGSYEEAAAFGEIIVLAVRGTVAESALSMTNGGDLSEKTILDATNPIEEGKMEDRALNFFTDQNGSLMEQLQSHFSKGNFVKCFNSIGAHLMVNPQLAGGPPTMFICGDNESAKSEVKEILDLFGWETEDMGSAKAARAIEPLCMLWCIPGFRENRWGHAFKLLKV
jgi:predicted dinucleotide-binding enzyme